MLSDVSQQAAYSFDKPRVHSTRDRFKYDSLPKEVIQKQFGEFTREIDFIYPKSTVLPGKPNSSDPNQPEFSIGGPNGGTRNRFKYDSPPKETVKKYFGVDPPKGTKSVVPTVSKKRQEKQEEGGRKKVKLRSNRQMQEESGVSTPPM